MDSNDERILRAGPALRDLNAAAACHCGCHPRIGDYHEGGVACPCQQTPEERKEATALMFAALADLGNTLGWDVKQDEFDATAERLGVTNAVIECQAAPAVVSGIVDGRFFYLRERHGTWRVTLAPEDDPTLDIWDHTEIRRGVDIASGSEDDLYSANVPFSFAYMLEFAVKIVRDHVRRAGCSHAKAYACTSANFCPTCGVRLEEVS